MAKGKNEFVRGSADLMVLSVLADEPKYGYLVQQRVLKASGGTIKLPAGTLYPLLHRLEADGFVSSRTESRTGRQRKWYRLTAAGRKQLRSQARQWEAFAACLQSLLTAALKAK